MQINEPIIKDKEQNYIFRNKKITLLVKNGRLFCRIGGILKGFKEYFEGINNSSKKRKSLADISLDSEYDAENYNKLYTRPNLQCKSKTVKLSNL